MKKYLRIVSNNDVSFVFFSFLLKTFDVFIIKIYSFYYSINFVWLSISCFENTALKFYSKFFSNDPQNKITHLCIIYSNAWASKFIYFWILWLNFKIKWHVNANIIHFKKSTLYLEQYSFSLIFFLFFLLIF
jgi:hypothetical protein